MNDYLLNRVIAGAAHTLRLAQLEAQIQHRGLKGRFRELLVAEMLVPWLPPYIACGSGMIIAGDNQERQSTQDDIILFDRALTPPILAASSHSHEGVFLFNSVLARIEVKSKLTRADIRAFVVASKEIASLRVSVQPGCTTQFFSAFNLLFAFDSDALGEGNADFQLRRLLDVMEEEGCPLTSGVVSMLCIPGYGFWKIANRGNGVAWERLVPNTPENNLAWFVACISNSCYLEHAKRQGRDPAHGLEGGVGMYFPDQFERMRP